jgi:hypothetical protein
MPRCLSISRLLPSSLIPLPSSHQSASPNHWVLKLGYWGHDRD